MKHNNRCPGSDTAHNKLHSKIQSIIYTDTCKIY